jgi:hypothetical protein
MVWRDLARFGSARFGFQLNEGWFWERKRKRVCVVDGFIYFTSSILFFMLTGTLVLGASSCSQ